MQQSHLFQPFTLRGVTMPNRIVISPMCQYSAIDGVATDWHFVHLGKFAQGGAGVVMVEASFMPMAWLGSRTPSGGRVTRSALRAARSLACRTWPMPSRWEAA